MALPCLETISMASWSSLTFLISGKSPLRASLAVIDMTANPPMMVQDIVPLRVVDGEHPIRRSRSGSCGSICRAQGLQQPVRPGQRGGYPAVVVRWRLEPGAGGDDGVGRGHRLAAGVAAARPVDLPAVGGVLEQPPWAARGAIVVSPAHQGQD